MTRKQKLWFYGLGSGFLGGMWTSIDSGLVVMIAAPREFNFDGGTMKTLTTIGIIGALAGAKVAVAYMKQSPLPPLEGETEFIQNKNTNTMKIIVAITALLVFAYLKTHAAEPPGLADAHRAQTAPGRFIESISLAPVGVIKTEHLDGPSQWGAGLDLGAAINPFVSLHVVNLSFQGADEQWGGLLVDETDLQIDAKISRFSNESFSLHLVSGGQTDWNERDYGINAGLRADLAFNKHVSLSAGYSIRTWFKGGTRVDSLASAQVNFSF